MRRQDRYRREVSGCDVQIWSGRDVMWQGEPAVMRIGRETDVVREVCSDMRVRVGRWTDKDVTAEH